MSTRLSTPPLWALAGLLLLLGAPPMLQAQEAEAPERTLSKEERKEARLARRAAREAARPAVDGAAVYRASCNRCHNARTLEELSPEKWEIVVTHMQVRGSLPQRDVDALLAWMAPPQADEADSGAAAESTYPDLPVLAEQCVRCHGIDRIVDATVASRDADWWRGTLRRMVGYGAPLNPQQQAELAEALEAHGAGSTGEE